MEAENDGAARSNVFLRSLDLKVKIRMLSAVRLDQVDAVFDDTKSVENSGNGAFVLYETGVYGECYVVFRQNCSCVAADKSACAQK